MTVRLLDELSFFDPEFAAPDCLEPGTFPWLLAREDSLLFPSWIFKGWHGEKPGRGRCAWPAPLLAKVLLLRWSEEGMSRRASVREAEHNIQWRAAMRLPVGGDTPSEKCGPARKDRACLRALSEGAPS